MTKGQLLAERAQAERKLNEGYTSKEFDSILGLAVNRKGGFGIAKCKGPGCRNGPNGKAALIITHVLQPRLREFCCDR